MLNVLNIKHSDRSSKFTKKPSWLWNYADLSSIAKKRRKLNLGHPTVKTAQTQPVGLFTGRVILRPRAQVESPNKEFMGRPRSNPSTNRCNEPLPSKLLPCSSFIEIQILCDPTLVQKNFPNPYPIQVMGIPKKTCKPSSSVVSIPRNQLAYGVQEFKGNNYSEANMQALLEDGVLPPKQMINCPLSPQSWRHSLGIW